MAIIIRQEGTWEILRDTSLKSLQTAVGGNIQVLRTMFNNLVLVTNEEGKLKNYEQNVLATMLVERWLLPDDFIAGDTVLAFAEEID